MKEISLFNSPLEAGVRAVVILNAIYPRKCDVSTMVWFDHLVVHTGDINGPASLHPDVPHRNGELLIRRSLVENGLETMCRLNFLVMNAEKDGITYQSTDDAFSFVQLLRSNYSIKLKERAQWLNEYILKLDNKALEELVTEKIGRWDIEFASSTQPWVIKL